MSKKYFDYLLKSQKHSIIFLTVINAIGLAVSFSAFNGNNRLEAALGCSLIINMLLTFISGPVLFRMVDDRKAVDTYFPVCVKRRDMLNTILLFAIMLAVIPFIADVSITAFMQVCWKHKFAFDYLRFMLPVTLALIGLTVFNSCTFLLANSVFDGIVAMLAYTCMPFIFYAVTGTFFEECIYGYSPDLSIFAYMSLAYNTMSNGFLSIVLLNEGISYLPWIIGAVLYTVIGYYGAYRNFVNRKNERAESISDELLSYPALITIYSACLILTVAFASGLNELSFILYFLIFIAYTVANFVYKRKIRIQLKSVLFFVGMIALATILTHVAYKTNGFGISYTYDHHPSNVSVSYSSEVDRYGEFKDIFDAIKEKEGSSSPYISEIEYGTINFELTIRDTKRDGYDQMMEVINRFRDSSIAQHYEGTLQPKYDYFQTSWMSLTEITATRHSRNSHYSCYQPLSLNDLLVIDRYCPVYIKFYSDMKSFRISDYLPSDINI
ncbi:MAG: hypothetical protein IJS38_04400 [Erysipelotrichaceae bacterium]|nr:hypothetical protein [Erysipelotrichaceae bacterium]